MINRILKFGLTALLATSFACVAQVPAGAPEGSSGQCKDGTYTSAHKKSGACSGHGGLQAWFGKSTSARRSQGQPDNANTAGTGRDTSGNAQGNTGAPAGAAEGNRRGVATPNNSGKTMPGPAANSGSNGAASSHSNRGSGAAAPGGGPGMVWVNTESKVYHCYGTRFYGKTKQGKYVTEQEAKQMGAKPERGKSCSQ